MNNSKLFTDAHKMTKLTIQHNETYRYKFGQWLIFLKTGVTNVLRVTNINQSVGYVPILSHDKNDKFIYSLSLPLTLTRRKGSYSESYYLGKMFLSFVSSLLDNKLFILFIIIMQFMLILEFI